MCDVGSLLSSFTPAEPRAERLAAYRNWRILKGETVDPDDNTSVAAASRSDITPAHFEVEHLLGEGNYSQVILATLKSTQQRCALKVIDKQKVKRYKKEDEVLVERWLLRNIKHPSIVDMYHTFQEVGALYLSLELLPGGELWALTHRCGLPYGVAKFYAAQMLEVLQFLHERDIVHRCARHLSRLCSVVNAWRRASRRVQCGECLAPLTLTPLSSPHSIAGTSSPRMSSLLPTRILK